MSNKKRNRRTPIPDYKGLPIWKIPFKVFGRLIMGLIFFAGGIGLPIALAIFWGDLVALGDYNFFGTRMSTVNIALIAMAIFVPLSIYGLVVTGKMLVKDLKKEKFQLDWKPKVAAIGLIGFVIFTAIYYTPGFYLYFGINPKWGPYLEFYGDDGMQVSWDSRTPMQSKVLYGTDPNNLDMEATGGVWSWIPKEESNHHCVALTGLTPGQEYYYMVPGFDNNIYHFTMAPEPTSNEPVCFTILGDTQGNHYIQNLNTENMIDSIGIDNIDYTVIVGDSVNQDDDIAEWDMLMRKDSYGGLTSYVPWHATSGNHECGVQGEYDFYEPRQKFEMIHQQPFMQDREAEAESFDIGYYYSFNYSNVHMVILDNFEKGGNILSDTQLSWLDEDLSRNEDNWKFLCFHLSVYSSSDHGSYPELAAQIEPLMDEHNVEAIFYGHDHIFEYYDINATEADHTLAFMCAGGGGGLKAVTNPDKMGDRVWPTDEEHVNDYGNAVLEISEWTEDDRFESQYGWESQVYAERCHHYMKVEVDGNEATFSAYRTFDNSLITAVEYTRS